MNEESKTDMIAPEIKVTEEIKKWPDGSIRSHGFVAFFLVPKHIGRRRGWYENGKLSSDTYTSINGRGWGAQIRWYESGRLQSCDTMWSSCDPVTTSIEFSDDDAPVVTRMTSNGNLCVAMYSPDEYRFEIDGGKVSLDRYREYKAYGATFNATTGAFERYENKDKGILVQASAAGAVTMVYERENGVWLRDGKFEYWWKGKQVSTLDDFVRLSREPRT